MKYITAAGVQTVATTANGIIIQANKAGTTETIIVALGGVTIATITAPWTSASRWEYTGGRGQGALTINPSAPVDLTISFVNRQF